MDDSIKKTNRLIVFTIAYNLAEGFFAIFFGIEENSTTLLSFGLDSFIEIFASSVALLGLSKLEIFSEERAEKLIAYSFLILIAFIVFKSSYDLINVNKPDPSFYGVILAVVSILIEGPLGYKKLKLGREMNNPVIIAEAKETLFCLNLSILVILGVGLNFLFSLWYFDPIAALLMIPWLYKEYKEHR